MDAARARRHDKNHHEENAKPTAKREAAVLRRSCSRTAGRMGGISCKRAGVPAARVRTMGEAVGDPQFKPRGIIHRHAVVATDDYCLRRTTRSACTFAHDGPRIDAPPPHARPAQCGDFERDRRQPKLKPS